MKGSIQARLETVSERHEEIAALLGEAEIISDQNQFRALSQEYSQLEPLVTAFNGYQTTQAALDSAKEMAKD